MTKKQLSKEFNRLAKKLLKLEEKLATIEENMVMAIYDTQDLQDDITDLSTIMCEEN